MALSAPSSTEVQLILKEASVFEKAMSEGVGGCRGSGRQDPTGPHSACLHNGYEMDAAPIWPFGWRPLFRVQPTPLSMYPKQRPLGTWLALQLCQGAREGARFAEPAALTWRTLLPCPSHCLLVPLPTLYLLTWRPH